MTRLNEAWAVLSDPGQRRRATTPTLGIRVRRPFAEPIAVDPDGGARLPFDADLEDLFDARPYSAGSAGPHRLVGVGAARASSWARWRSGAWPLVFDSPAMLGGAVVLFAVSCSPSPCVAMWTLRSGARR